MAKEQNAANNSFASIYKSIQLSKEPESAKAVQEIIKDHLKNLPLSIQFAKGKEAFETGYYAQANEIFAKILSDKNYAHLDKALQFKIHLWNDRAQLQCHYFEKIRAHTESEIIDEKINGIVKNIEQHLKISNHLLANEVDSLMAYVDLMYAYNQLEEAVPYLLQALKKQPHSPYINLLLGNYYRNTPAASMDPNKNAKIMEHYAIAIKFGSGPLFAQVHLCRAAHYHATGKHDKALEDITIYLKQYPNDADALKFLAKLSSITNKSGVALPEPKKAEQTTTLAPENTDTQSGNADTEHHTEKEYLDIIKSLSRRIKTNKSVSEHYYKRGCTYDALRQYDSALADMQEACKLDKNDYRPVLMIGNILLKTQKYNEAKTHLNFLDNCPNIPLKNHAKFLLAETYFEEKNYTEALTCLGKIHGDILDTMPIKIAQLKNKILAAKTAQENLQKNNTKEKLPDDNQSVPSTKTEKHIKIKNCYKKLTGAYEIGRWEWKNAETLVFYPSIPADKTILAKLKIIIPNVQNDNDAKKQDGLLIKNPMLLSEDVFDKFKAFMQEKINAAKNKTEKQEKLIQLYSLNSKSQTLHIHIQELSKKLQNIEDSAKKKLPNLHSLENVDPDILKKLSNQFNDVNSLTEVITTLRTQAETFLKLSTSIITIILELETILSKKHDKNSTDLTQSINEALLKHDRLNAEVMAFKKEMETRDKNLNNAINTLTTLHHQLNNTTNKTTTNPSKKNKNKKLSKNIKNNEDHTYTHTQLSTPNITIAQEKKPAAPLEPYAVSVITSGTWIKNDKESTNAPIKSNFFSNPSQQNSAKTTNNILSNTLETISIYNKYLEGLTTAPYSSDDFKNRPKILLSACESALTIAQALAHYSRAIHHSSSDINVFSKLRDKINYNLHTLFYKDDNVLHFWSDKDPSSFILSFTRDCKNFLDKDPSEDNLLIFANKIKSYALYNTFQVNTTYPGFEKQDCLDFLLKQKSILVDIMQNNKNIAENSTEMRSLYMSTIIFAHIARILKNRFNVYLNVEYHDTSVFHCSTGVVDYITTAFKNKEAILNSIVTKNPQQPPLVELLLYTYSNESDIYNEILNNLSIEDILDCCTIIRNILLHDSPTHTDYFLKKLLEEQLPQDKKSLHFKVQSAVVCDLFKLLTEKFSKEFDELFTPSNNISQNNLRYT